LPVGGECHYAFRVETKTALVLGGGGITGGMYELGALSAMDDFIVSGRKSGESEHSFIEYFGLIRRQSRAPTR